MAGGRIIRCPNCGKLKLYGQQCAKCSDPTDGDAKKGK